MIKVANIDPLVADGITYGVGGLGIGAILAALTNATPKLIKSPDSPRSTKKVVPKRILRMPVYVDEATAKRLATRGIATKRNTWGDEQEPSARLGAGIDPMQKIADDIPGAVISAAKTLSPYILGSTAMAGGYYATDAVLDSFRKDSAKARYIAKRKQLNKLLAATDPALNGLEKVAHPVDAAMPWLLGDCRVSKTGSMMSDLLPWMVGVPALVGGAMTFGDGQDAAIAANPNIQKIKDLDQFYADLPDTPKMQLAPVLRAKAPSPEKQKVKQKKKKVAMPPQSVNVSKVAALNLGELTRKSFTLPGKANDIASGAGALVAVPAAYGLSRNIDDPTYKWVERVGMPLGIGAMLNRRLAGKTPVHKTIQAGALGELGLFGGLRYLDAATNRNPKALEAQGSAMRDATKYGLMGGAGIGALLLGSQVYGSTQERKESSRARRSQSRQLSKILKTVGARHVPGDNDGDGDVDEDDAALVTAGIMADPDPRKH